MKYNKYNEENQSWFFENTNTFDKDISRTDLERK